MANGPRTGRNKLKVHMGPFTIIVVLRSSRQLSGCLEAIRNYSGSKNKLSVIDVTVRGGSHDLAAATVDARTAAPHAVHVKSEHDPVKTCNTLIRECRHDQIVILDSAALVCEQWLQSLGTCLEKAPRAGIVGPLTGSHFFDLPEPVFGPAAMTGTYQNLNAALQERSRYRRIAVGTPDVHCLAVKTATIREIGYLDESFAEIDAALADLCLRAELAGYQNYLAGDVCIPIEDRRPLGCGKKALRDKWESLDPESDLRKHYEALNLCHRANQARWREETDQAVELFLKGIGLYPAEEKLYLDLAAMLSDAEKYADALQALREMPEADSSPAGQLLTGICQQGMGHSDEAWATVARILAVEGRSAAGLWLKGRLLMDRGEHARAETVFRQSITFDPGYGPAYTDLGNMESSRGAKKRALDLMERGFSLAPEYTTAATDYHTAISQQYDYQRAIPTFSEAAAVCRFNRRLRYLLVDVLLKAGKEAQAMAVIESLLADFGLEEGLLAAALAVRENLGPLEINNGAAHGDTIAFCLIVRDEEQDLPCCLASIKPVADEIVLVDTGSQDRTRDIARIFGARVFDFAWCDDFAAAKNFAVAQAEADWIFSIDADEVLGAQDHEALRTLIRTGHTAPVAYAVTTRNYLKVTDVIGWQPNDGCYPEEAGMGWMPSEKVRLFTRDPQVRFSYPVHEMVEPSLEKAKIPIVPCDIPIHHYGKLDQVRSLSKGETYYKIGLKKLADMEQSAIGIRELAIQAQTLGEYREAARLWERLLLLEPDQARVYINLGSVYLELGDYGRALEMTQKARDLDPGLKEGHFNHALSRLYLGDAAGAARVLEDLTAAYPEYTAARFMLAAASSCNGDDRRTQDMLDDLQRTRLAVGLPEALRHLARGLEKAGQQRHAKLILKLADKIQ